MDTQPERQSAYQPRTPWRPLWALAAAILIVAVSQVAPLFLFRVTGAASGPVPLTIGSPVVLMLMSASQVLMGGAAWWCAARFGGARRDVLALQPAAGSWIRYGVAIAVMLSVITGVNLFRQSVLDHDIYADLRVLAPMFRQPLWPVSLLIIGVGAPLAEEWLFRGFLQSALTQSRLGFVGAAVVATVIWTALHSYSVPGMIQVALLGCLFSWMLWWTGSLRVPIAAHAINNLIAGLYLQFGPQL
jgi:uncharacterized protein